MREAYPQNEQYKSKKTFYTKQYPNDSIYQYSD